MNNLYIFFICLILFIIIWIIIKKRTKWGKENNLFWPFIISLFFTLIICAVTLSLAFQTDKKIEDMSNKLSLVIGEKIGNSEVPLDRKILNISITPDGTIAYWITLSRPQDNYQRGYIFDIGDSLIKNRMSLFVDEYGFLNWRIIDDNFIEHTLKIDISEFLNGTRFFITLTWNKSGELILYVNAIPVSKVKLDSLNLDIKSKEFYIGSDIHGDYVINLNLPKVTMNY
jgi:hypothetical protein